MIEKAFVGWRCAVVNFVDDHDIEMIRREIGKPSGTNTLDRCKDVLPMGRALAAYPKLAEISVADRMAEGRKTLVQNVDAMRDEEKTRAREATAQSGVVDSRHHSLARARGSNE